MCVHKDASFCSGWWSNVFLLCIVLACVVRYTFWLIIQFLLYSKVLCIAHSWLYKGHTQLYSIAKILYQQLRSWHTVPILFTSVLLRSPTCISLPAGHYPANAVESGGGGGAEEVQQVRTVTFPVMCFLL